MNRTSLLRPHVEAELAASRATRGSAQSWSHLERAHVLSQPSARLHTRVHVAMFIAAMAALDLREVFGQVVRILVAGIGSWLGRYPVGNTGRARVPISQPLPIPQDLRAILEHVEAELVGIRRRTGGGA